MKEITKWDNNPRIMWVWDNEISQMTQLRVIYIKDVSAIYSVVALDEKGQPHMFKHCAEIEENLMTNKEFAKFIKENPAREWIKEPVRPGVIVQTTYVYSLGEENKTVDEHIVFREGKGKWRRPVKDLLKDSSKESCGIWDEKCEY